jgi:hypothetical protein
MHGAVEVKKSMMKIYYILHLLVIKPPGCFVVRTVTCKLLISSGPHELAVTCGNKSSSV